MDLFKGLSGSINFIFYFSRDTGFSMNYYFFYILYKCLIFFLPFFPLLLIFSRISFFNSKLSSHECACFIKQLRTILKHFWSLYVLIQIYWYQFDLEINIKFKKYAFIFKSLNVIPRSLPWFMRAERYYLVGCCYQCIYR